MEVVTVATIWLMFASFLIFPLLGLPTSLRRAALLLAYAEMLAFLIWSFGSEGCRARPCGALAEAGRTAAAVDIPLLSAALLVLATILVVRKLRRGEWLQE